MKQHAVSMTVLSTTLMLILPISCGGERRMHTSERGTHPGTPTFGQMRGHGHSQISFWYLLLPN